jgi:hypothetical protein
MVLLAKQAESTGQEPLSDAEADKINKDSESEEGLWIEKTVWISLFEAARLSIEHKTVVYFA